jgi:hypothetical protein
VLDARTWCDLKEGTFLDDDVRLRLCPVVIVVVVVLVVLVVIVYL